MKSNVKYTFLVSDILNKIIMTWNFYCTHVYISRLELKVSSFLHRYMQFIETGKNKPINFHLILLSSWTRKQYFNEVTPCSWYDLPETAAPLEQHSVPQLFWTRRHGFQSYGHHYTLQNKEIYLRQNLEV